MIPATTERADDLYRDLDLWSTVDQVSAMLKAQQQALAAIDPARAALAGAIEALAERLRAGGRMAYLGAGTSGMIAQMDALELPGTFGIARQRLPVILAGGMNSLTEPAGGSEDDEDAAEAAVDALAIGPDDGLVAVAASGSTPFTVAGLRRAARRGALTIGIACVPGAPLLQHSHHPILVETPPEVPAGSTRMAAGTAQKCALNLLSTGVASRLGHIYAGLMVNMTPNNAKLRRRAASIVATAAGVDLADAARALDRSDGSVKTAVMLCLLGDIEEARLRLRCAHGDIRGGVGPDSGGPMSRLVGRGGPSEDRRSVSPQWRVQR